MAEANFTLYLDESGTDQLFESHEFQANPALETHCTLLGTVLPNNRLPDLTGSMRSLKKRIWNTDDFPLHSLDIRHYKGVFTLFKYQPEIYADFKATMNQITADLTPSLICSSINKKLWVEKYPRKFYFQDDPYEQAFVYLLERYADFLNLQTFDRVGGKIIVEKRSALQDDRLKTCLAHIKAYGTQYMGANVFSRINPKIEFYKKEFNICGLQLSDYYAYPFYVNHRFPERENKHYDFLAKYIYAGKRGNNYGHKKWPV